jgi:hypothetical protein
MEAECYPETLVNFYRAIPRYILEDSNYSCVLHFSRLRLSTLVLYGVDLML